MALLDLISPNNQFGSALLKLAEQDAAYRRDQHMNKVFAANPRYAEALYGAKNQQEDSDVNRKLALLRLQKLSEGGDEPAALKLTNEYLKAKNAGDTERTKALELFAKIYDKGVVADPTGQIGALSGYGEAIGGIGAVKKGMERQAEKNVDLGIDPLIKYEESRQAALGAAKGEKEAQKINTGDALPSLSNTMKKLDELGQKATSTWAGTARDIIAQQSTGESTPQSDALVEYMNTGRNQLYPILRATLGAQFTAEEGERLLGTMVKEGASASQRRAILTAYIRGKLMEVDPEIQDARISDDGIEVKKGETWSGLGGLNSPQGGAVPLSSDSGMDEMPPASQHKGRIITDTTTKKRFKSDGTKWNPI